MRRTLHSIARSLVLPLFAVVMLVNCGGSGGSSIPPPKAPVVPTGVPEAPASVIATAVSGTQVNISWSSVPDATSYSVYRSGQTGTPYTYTVSAGTTATTVTDTTVTSGATYYYVVAGANSFGEGAYSAEVSAVPAAPSGTLIISGAMKYEDREYDQYVGLTGKTMFKAVRFAEVQLVNASTSATLFSTLTDSKGLYSFSTSTNTGSTVYVRVLSAAAPAGTDTVSIKNLSASPALYAVKTANFALNGDATVNLSIPVSNTADGAFNALDVFTSGYAFVTAYAGTSPPTLSAFWQPGNTNGTYYCSGYGCLRGNGIYIYSSYDTDEFDDDVLWHEFGHFIADRFSKDDSPGGLHYLDDNTQDLRLTWSEGWGNFFPGAIKYWLYANDPGLLSADPGRTPLSQYVDTVTGDLYLTVNIAAPESNVPYRVCYSDDCKYASNEISIANVLWNTMSGPGLGMTKIWDVFDNYLPGVVAHSVNIEDFWDGWLASYPADSTALHTVFFNDRLIDYSEDSYEMDDSFAFAKTFTVNSGQSHRITGNGDMDYVLFSVPTGTAQYTIRTSSLRNGADTYLTLFDNTGVVEITNNDNATTPPVPTPNNTTALSSQIVRTLAPGTYYVSVRSSPSKPASAGRYGSYTLTITTQ